MIGTNVLMAITAPPASQQQTAGAVCSCTGCCTLPSALPITGAFGRRAAAAFRAASFFLACSANFCSSLMLSCISSACRLMASWVSMPLVMMSHSHRGACAHCSSELKPLPCQLFEFNHMMWYSLVLLCMPSSQTVRASAPMHRTLHLQNNHAPCLAKSTLQSARACRVRIFMKTPLHMSISVECKCHKSAARCLACVHWTCTSHTAPLPLMHANARYTACAPATVTVAVL